MAGSVGLGKFESQLGNRNLYEALASLHLLMGWTRRELESNGMPWPWEYPTRKIRFGGIPRRTSDLLHCDFALTKSVQRVPAQHDIELFDGLSLSESLLTLLAHCASGQLSLAGTIVQSALSL